MSFFSPSPQVSQATLDSLKNYVQSESTKGTLRSVLQTAAIAGGVGAGMRGLKALTNTAQRGEDLDIDLPANRKTKLLLPLPYAKAAAVGDVATTPIANPLHLPGVAAAMVAGGLGGYKLTDTLLDNVRRGRLENEMESAQRKFDEATLEMYDHKKKAPPPAVEPLPFPKAAAIDAPPPPAPLTPAPTRLIPADAKGTLLGAYLLWAAGTGLPAFNAGYSTAQKKDGFKTLEDAARVRARRLGEVSPSPVQAVGVPMSEQA
jgi:hypothetical protein